MRVPTQLLTDPGCVSYQTELCSTLAEPYALVLIVSLNVFVEAAIVAFPKTTFPSHPWRFDISLAGIRSFFRALDSRSAIASLVILFLKDRLLSS